MSCELSLHGCFQAGEVPETIDDIRLTGGGCMRRKNTHDCLDSGLSDRRQFRELRNGAKRAAVPRGRRRSAAPVVGHHGHSTAPQVGS